ncbi:MAG: hypothetical protein K2K98_12000 [Muribaculaceae bacterium]|nr:hypothetical protein [Muribaculaceae bacterium]
MGEAKPPTHWLRSIVVNNQLSAGWEACCSIRPIHRPWRGARRQASCSREEGPSRR